MSSRSMLIVGLALLASVACGQRQPVRLASDDAATEPAAVQVPAAADPAEATVAPLPPGPRPSEEAPPTARPSPDPEPTGPPEESRGAPAHTDTADGSRPEPSETADPGAVLWNRSFAATSVEVAGQPRPIVEDTELYVMPFRARDDRGIRYHTGCNTGAASLRITAERFLVADDGAMTAVGCSAEHGEQERWFLEFIDASPKWQLSRDGTQLRLSSGDTAVTFVEQAWDPWTTSS